MASQVYGQKSIELLGEPEENYGYLIWKGDTSQIEYYRYTISERIHTPSGIQLNTLERGEVWNRTFLYINPIYWSKFELNGTEYALQIQGVDNNGLDIPGEDLEICSGCPAFVPDCFWECVSSDYAYRLQMFEGTGGTNNYRLEMARQTDLDGVSVPYYEWFNTSDFNNYILNPFNAPLRGMSNFSNPSDYWENAPFQMVKILSEDNDGSFHNYARDEIEGDVYGIQKGLGQWYPEESETIWEVNVNYCEDAEPFETVNTYFNNMFGFDPALICMPDLGSGDYEEWEDDGPPGPYKDWINFIVPVKYKPDDNGGGSNGDGGIVVDNTNWTEYVSDLFNFNSDPYTDSELRYSEMLMNCQTISVSKLAEEGYENILLGSTSAFTDPNGLPNIPIMNFEKGLYSVALKRSGFPLMYGIFEVRDQFTSALPHKDFFDAIIYPNPIVEDHFFVDVLTTARLWVKYEIFDSNGNQVYEYTIQLPKDHSATHRIETDNPLPQGFLYHKFTFADGSYETISTIKN